MTALAKRVIRQIAGDKRTIALIILAPMLILTLLYLLLGGTNYKPVIAVYNLPVPLIDELKNQDVNIINISDDDFETYLSEHRDIDAVFSAQKIVMYEANSKSSAAMKAIQNAVAALNPAPAIKTEFIIGSTDETMFQELGYVFLSVISFFLIFIVSGMALVRERSGGTLERLLMTPISRSSVVIGYTVGYGLFAVIQAIILVLFSLYVLNIPCAGNIIWVVLTMLLLAIAAVSFGELISIFSNTEFQVVQMIPITIIPQIFFSGLIPLDTIPYNLGLLGYIMPIFYGSSAIKEVMRAGAGFEHIWMYLFALVIYIFVLSILNALALKKYRKM